MIDSLAEQKKALRSRMLRERDSRFAALLTMSSDRIIRHLQQWSVFREAKNIMAYSPIDSEVDIWPLVSHALRKEKRILLPRIQQGELVAVPCREGSVFRVSEFGIREPLGKPFPPEKIHLILLPGLAFDRQGNRLGYGGGYYDRFLIGLTAYRCGIGYGFQLLPSLPYGPRDISVDSLATEKGIIEVLQK